MAHTLHPVDLADAVCSAQEHVGDAALAGAVVLPVRGGKGLHKHPREFILLVHVHILPGDEHIVEHGDALAAHAGIFEIALVDGVLRVQLAAIVGLASEDIGNTRGVHGAGEDHRVILGVLLHVLGGEDHQLMGA